MAERPILFQGAMVRAILDGSKTQTRRVCKPAATLSAVVAVQDPDEQPPGQRPPYLTPGWFGDEDGEVQFFSPYGAPGDRLWVRETWAQNWNQLSDTRMDRSYVYRADGGPRAQDNGTDLPWKPSIHMPRWVSRITLEITDVRVERLQDISEADAIAEGIENNPRLDPAGTCHWRVYGAAQSTGTNLPERSYESLWTSINGPGSWDANPWVWVVEFRKVMQ